MIVKVGIQAPDRAAFISHLGALISAGRLPASVAGIDQAGTPEMKSAQWGVDRGGNYVSYGEGFAFVEFPAEMDGVDLVSPAVLYGGYTIIIEADAELLGLTNVGTPDSPVWENDETVIPAAWLNMNFIDQLVRG